MEKLYTVRKKKRWGADCGSDHELLPYCQIQTEIKESGENHYISYDLSKIPYNHTGEVRKRFKGLDLTDRVPDELWNEVRDIVQEAVIKTIPKT